LSPFAPLFSSFFLSEWRNISRIYHNPRC
jgi:hypothetical protein